MLDFGLLQIGFYFSFSHILCGRRIAMWLWIARVVTLFVVGIPVVMSGNWLLVILIVAAFALSGKFIAWAKKLWAAKGKRTDKRKPAFLVAVLVAAVLVYLGVPVALFKLLSIPKAIILSVVWLAIAGVALYYVSCGIAKALAQTGFFFAFARTGYFLSIERNGQYQYGLYDKSTFEFSSTGEISYELKKQKKDIGFWTRLAAHKGLYFIGVPPTWEISSRTMSWNEKAGEKGVKLVSSNENGIPIHQIVLSFNFPLDGEAFQDVLK